MGTGTANDQSAMFSQCLVVSTLMLACALVSCQPGNLESSGDSDSARIALADENTFIQMCLKGPEHCVQQCQGKPEHCAKLINEFVESNFKSWNLYPGRNVGDTNPFTPMHGSNVSIYVNPIAYNYVEQVSARVKAGDIDEVNYPNGSIIVKQNAASANMDATSDPWLTVMFKLDGYCSDNTAAASCAGGDWFYYLRRFGDFRTFNGIPAYGKPEAFCIDCHNPVQKADFVWTTFKDIHRQQTDVPRAQSSNPGNVNLVSQCENLYLSTQVPADVAVDPSMDPMAQRMFDCLSWRSFIALNQPNRDPGQSAPWRGLPKQNANIADPGDRVWETYQSVFETFQPNVPGWTLENRSWNDAVPIASVCEGQQVGDKVFQMTSKNRASAMLDEDHEAFGNQFNILVDQNQQKVLFEVRLNRDEWEFVKANGYANTGNYDVGGPLAQLSWQATPIQFPDNTTGFTGTGAIEIKAAWRRMCFDPENCDKLDDPDRYYTREAFFLERSSGNTPSQCVPVTVGLVGLHIAHKTFWSPQWVWSTFEHVDNVPAAASTPTTGPSYSFYDPALAAKQPHPANCMTQRPGIFPVGAPDPVPFGAPDPIPSIENGLACPNLQSITNSHPGHEANSKLLSNQVTRIDSISNTPLNTEFPALLKSTGSVFQYYRLVNTQWPSGGRRGTDKVNTRSCRDSDSDRKTDCYTIMPKLFQPGHRLRNTTMETYQVSYVNPDAGHDNAPPSRDGQYSSMGCIQCHGNAGVDFSFIWSDAVEEMVPLAQTTNIQ